MATLKDVVQVVEKLGLNLNKIPISNRSYREIIEKTKAVSFVELLKKKNDPKAPRPE